MFLRRAAAAGAFGLAAFFCQTLTWLFLTVEDDYWNKGTLLLEILAIPVTMLVASVTWPTSKIKPKIATLMGFTVLMFSLAILSLIGSYFMGPFEELSMYFYVYMFFSILAAKTIGFPLLFSFLFVGYLMHDEEETEKISK